MEQKFTSVNSPKIYEVWHGMITRADDAKWKETHPTYKDCTVCDEWRDFQVFAKWYTDNIYDFPGKLDLDKDLLIEGNKHYSPETCLIIPHVVNQFIADVGVKKESGLPKGVDKQGNRYAAYIGGGRRLLYLGAFDTAREASKAYKAAKAEQMREFAQGFTFYCPKKVIDAMQKRYEKMVGEI